MVEILVGPSEHAFRVHKTVLCGKIPYFDKMFNGGFKEAQEQYANLPDDDPDAFGLFLEWLYVGRIPPIPRKSISNNEERTKMHLDRIKLYCFAEKIMAPTIMDSTITSIIRAHIRNNTSPGFLTIEFAYQNSPSTSCLRKYMSLVVHDLTTSSLVGWSNEEFHNFLMKLGEGMMDLVGLLRGSSGQVTSDPHKLPICTFHAHSEKEVCRFKEDAEM